MPFPGQPAGISVLCQDFGIAPETVQIADGPVPRQLLSRPGVLPGSVRILMLFPKGGSHLLIVQMTLADPVMDAVLGGHSAAQHRSPGRGADRRRTEILRKIHALSCQPVQVRRPNLPVPRAAHGPIPHVVRHHHDDIRLICHTLVLPSIFFGLYFTIQQAQS